MKSFKTVLEIKEDNLEVYQTFDETNVLIFKTTIEGEQKPSFYKKDELELSPSKMVIFHVPTKKEIVFDSKNDQYVDISDLYYDLKDPTDSGSLLSASIKRAVEIWGFGRVKFSMLKPDSYYCDCCGHVENKTIYLENLITKSHVSFHESDHFGDGYMPTFYDIMNFIIHGECQDDYLKDD